VGQVVGLSRCKTGVFTLTDISISVLIACSIVAAPTAASILIGAMQLGNAVMMAVMAGVFSSESRYRQMTPLIGRSMMRILFAKHG
jgi:hypothetical protein